MTPMHPRSGRAAYEDRGKFTDWISRVCRSSGERIARTHAGGSPSSFSRTTFCLRSISAIRCAVSGLPPPTMDAGLCGLDPHVRTITRMIVRGVRRSILDARTVSLRENESPRSETAPGGDSSAARREIQGRTMIEVMPTSVTVPPLTVAPGAVHCWPILMRCVPAATMSALTPVN